MKKIFSILAIAALMAGCSKEDSTTDVAPATFTLTGYTSNDTRTAFGDPYEANPDDWRIPFIWSDDDVIWSGNQQSIATVINSNGSASFTFASEPESTIYYNMTGTSAAADVPAEQDANNSLGANGDFGYATVTDGTFTLNHATAYLRIIPLVSDNKDTEDIEDDELVSNITLNSITIDTSDGVIAGKAEWNGLNFEVAPNGSRKITLNVNQKLNYEDDDFDPFYHIVVLPTELTGEVKFTYKFTNKDGETKYYTKTRDGKTLSGGVTYELLEEIYLSQLTDYRELRVLTFEDEDKKFSQYKIGSYTINTWSNLIVAAEDQAYNESTLIYGSEYYWEDTNNTGLYHKFPFNWGGYALSGGGAAISCHTVDKSTLEACNGTTMYDYQLSVVTNGGHDGSTNFAVVYNDSTVGGESKVELSFTDGEARVIDHMYVTTPAIPYYCIKNGSDFSDKYDEDDFLKIVATGFKEDNTTSTVEFYLANGSNECFDDWQKWDLSGLGKVKKIQFHMEEAQIDDYGYAKYYKTGLYFAFDDVAVQF